MAHAYTPSLRVTGRTVLRKRRLLPLKGQVQVEKGYHVQAEDVIARAALPGKVHTINVVNLLSIDPADVKQFMVKKAGESVQQGDVIAENKPLIKWFRTQVKSPITGALENISEVTGQVLLREPPQPVELLAYVDGVVVEVLPQEGALVETTTAMVQGIFGIGGETRGPIAVAVEQPDQPLTPERLEDRHKGAVVIGGSYAPSKTFARAAELGVAALVVGGIDDQDLRDLLKYDLGVAITGIEQVGFTLIVTEGFGEIAMAQRTFDLLASLKDRMASVCGATQIRAGVLRPEILVAQPAEEQAAEGARYHPPAASIEVGDVVRAIREPYFGLLGTVRALPNEPQVIESETKARILELEFQDHRRALVPRANVEKVAT